MTHADPLSYRRLAKFDDPEKPWKSVWACPATGIFVKIHADRSDSFGRTRWLFTGTHCDEKTGKALSSVHAEEHSLTVQNDRGVKRPDAIKVLKQLAAAESPDQLIVARDLARALVAEQPTHEQLKALILEDYDREARFMVMRVERAALDAQTVQQLGGSKPPPPVQNPPTPPPPEFVRKM